MVISGDRPESEILDLITPDFAGQDLGFSALYCACSVGSPASVVAKLVHLFPQAAAQFGFPEHVNTTGSGDVDVPVFVACSRSMPCLETIDILIDAYPGCLRASTNHPPLFHICVRLDNSEKVLALRRLVYNRSIDAGIPIMDTRDLAGFYPIHHLAQSRNVHLMKEWLEAAPGRFVDDQPPCNTLVHIAVEDMLHTGHNPEMVEYLVGRFPDAITTTNEKGELPIHLSLWPQDRDILLREHPWTLLCMDKDGKDLLDRIVDTIDEIFLVHGARAALGDYSWVDSARMESQEYNSEAIRLFRILCERVFPVFEKEVMGVLQHHGVPSELLRPILKYALPHY
jgi:hypothetical protein